MNTVEQEHPRDIVPDAPEAHISILEADELFRNGHVSTDTKRGIRESRKIQETVDERLEDNTEYVRYTRLVRRLGRFVAHAADKTLHAAFTMVEGSGASKLLAPAFESSMHRRLQKRDRMRRVYDRTVKEATLEHIQGNKPLIDKLKNEISEGEEILFGREVEEVTNDFNRRKNYMIRYLTEESVYSFAKALPRVNDKRQERPFAGDYDLLSETVLDMAIQEKSADGVIPLVGSDYTKQQVVTEVENGKRLREVRDDEHMYLGGVAALMFKLGFIEVEEGVDLGFVANYGKNAKFNKNLSIENKHIKNGASVRILRLPYNPDNEYHRRIKAAGETMDNPSFIEVGLVSVGTGRSDLTAESKILLKAA